MSWTGPGADLVSSPVPPPTSPVMSRTWLTLFEVLFLHLFLSFFLNFYWSRVVSVSAVQQSDSVIHILISTHF